MATRRHRVGSGRVHLLVEGKPIRLRPAPYSEKNLTDGNFLNLQPYKGGWIVSFQGEHLGSVKRSKKGWATSGYPSGARAAKVDEAMSMLDEYYAAGGR
jgi:hypothetical protein